MAKNTASIVKKTNSRMQLLQTISSFGASPEDLKQIYISFIRSHLEKSCTVWHSGLTEENSNDLERIQKSALKLILKKQYTTYQNALNLLQLENLKNRRESLCLQFAKKCLTNTKMKRLFHKIPKKHKMLTRLKQKISTKHARKKRLKNSPVIFMQKLLNQES